MAIKCADFFQVNFWMVYFAIQNMYLDKKVQIMQFFLPKDSCIFYPHEQFEKFF